MQKSNVILITDDSHRAVMANALANELELISYNKNIIISCGLETVKEAVAKKKQSGAVLVSVLDPMASYEEFNFIFTPIHEPHPDLPNIYPTHGLLNSMTPKNLISDGRFDYLPKPVIAVLIGGKHIGGDFTIEDANGLARFLNSKNASVLLTTSRRTEIMVAQKFKEKIDRPHYIYEFNYDGQDDNPYIQMVAAADEIIVSADSARMMSEAASSGKNVSIFYPKELHFSYKAMADELITSGYANNMSAFGSPTMLLNEAKRCANIIASVK